MLALLAPAASALEEEVQRGTGNGEDSSVLSLEHWGVGGSGVVWADCTQGPAIFNTPCLRRPPDPPYGVQIGTRPGAIAPPPVSYTTGGRNTDWHIYQVRGKQQNSACCLWHPGPWAGPRGVLPLFKACSCRTSLQAYAAPQKTPNGSC